MSDIILKVENLSKLYRLGEVGTGTLSHDLNRWLAKIRGKEDPFSKVGEINDRTSNSNSKNGYVWSLKDINFEVKRGDVVGIIGKNGAGKSTLLKVISQITAPTSGCVKANGRIASLLEVGTGMHPEMTGRENIYLNGTILGMRKYEIDRKFDEIVDFAGCAKYVDTPVKRYSSGMKVRLGFAVAAFLEPEILIVDEVLAVGDAEFQKKAIGKMQDVSREGGRTVLFVSHNMAAVQRLCSKSIILKNGMLVNEGNTEEIISTYLEQNIQEINEGIIDRVPKKETPFIEKVEVFNSKNECTSDLLFGEPFSIQMKLSAKQNYNHVEPLIAVNTIDDYRVFTAISSDVRKSYSLGPGNEKLIKINFNERLTPGQYKLIFDLRSGRHVSYDLLFDALRLNISEQVYNDTTPNEKVLGLIRVLPEWD